MLYHYPRMLEIGKTMVASSQANSVREAAWDGVGMAASCLCLIHCLAFPLLIAALPTLASVVGEGEAFHFAILAIAIPSSFIALWLGRARHRALWPIGLGAIGLIVLTLASLEFLPEIPATVTGSLMLVTAHIANWRYRHAAIA